MSEEAVGLCEVLIVGTSPPKELFAVLKADAAVVDIFGLVAKKARTPGLKKALVTTVKKRENG